jgi:hypothetical protein
VLFTKYEDNTSKEDEVSGVWGMKNALNTLVEKPEWKRTLGIPRHSYVDNIKMDLRERGLEYVNSIHLAHMSSTINFLVL